MTVLLLREVVRDVCAYLNNYFVKEQDRVYGEFSLFEGKIRVDMDFGIGQWIALTPGVGVFKIVDKVTRNEGYTYTLAEADSFNHRWSGTIYKMNIPLPFLRLCERIFDYRNSEEGVPTKIAGERVANVYQWTAATGKDGKPLSWSGVFADELNTFRGQAFTGVSL